MTSSMPSLESWLPPPEAWPEFACRGCESVMRVPFAPSDGLCPECRAGAASPAVETTEARLASAGAPGKYAAFTRASWEGKYGPWQDHATYRHLVGWPHETPADSWLVLITSSGYGDRKTGLGTAVLGEALDHGTLGGDRGGKHGALGDRGKRGLRGLWLAQSDWLRALKASWNGGRDVEPEHVVWNRAAQADVLMFDELGGVEALNQPEKAWWRVQVTQLLQHRECRHLPTIVTANLANWRQVSRIHESLVSRMDVSLKITLPSGRDYRALERKRGARRG